MTQKVQSIINNYYSDINEQEDFIYQLKQELKDGKHACFSNNNSIKFLTSNR